MKRKQNVYGADKTTMIRILLGLVMPSEGTATINGRAYRDLPALLNLAMAAALSGLFSLLENNQAGRG